MRCLCFFMMPRGRGCCQTSCAASVCRIWLSSTLKMSWLYTLQTPAWDGTPWMRWVQGPARCPAPRALLHGRVRPQQTRTSLLHLCVSRDALNLTHYVCSVTRKWRFSRNAFIEAGLIVHVWSCDWKHCRTDGSNEKRVKSVGLASCELNSDKTKWHKRKHQQGTHNSENNTEVKESESWN